MRYAPEYGLAFLHIPKNGGQSVRNALKETCNLSYKPLAADLNVSEEKAALAGERGFNHPELGDVHPAHIPLFFLERYFPASWDVLCSSKSFALIREPRSRFISAMMQRLKEFEGKQDVRIFDPVVKDEAARVCDWLNSQKSFARLEYIHFARQVDFVALSGERIVDRIFPMDQADIAARWLKETVNLDIEIKHQHSRRQPKNWARGIVPLARFAARTLMPQKVKSALHPLWMKSGFFDTAAKRYTELELTSEVEDFISNYYSEDFSLLAEAKALAAERNVAA